MPHFRILFHFANPLFEGRFEREVRFAVDAQPGRGPSGAGLRRRSGLSLRKDESVSLTPSCDAFAQECAPRFLCSLCGRRGHTAQASAAPRSPVLFLSRRRVQLPGHHPAPPLHRAHAFPPGRQAAHRPVRGLATR